MDLRKEKEDGFLKFHFKGCSLDDKAETREGLRVLIDPETGCVQGLFSGQEAIKITQIGK